MRRVEHRREVARHVLRRPGTLGRIAEPHAGAVVRAHSRAAAERDEDAAVLKRRSQAGRLEDDRRLPGAVALEVNPAAADVDALPCWDGAVQEGRLGAPLLHDPRDRNRHEQCDGDERGKAQHPTSLLSHALALDSSGDPLTSIG